jgi:glyoxylase-like metal-dependent hydrolase (beta-lactamase superfamily II)
MGMTILSKNGFTVQRTTTRRCACYIIKTKKYNVLVDTSVRFERDNVAKSIQAAGIQKIDAIFLTHSHTDHVANAQYFSEVFRCKVYVSEKGLIKIRRGCCIMPKGTNLFGRLICKAEPRIPFYRFTRFQACPHAEPLNTEVVKFYLGESSELLETPGHTDDSVSILTDDGIALVGDAMVNTFGNLYPPFADEEKAVTASWKALLDTRCRLFCPAHGVPLDRETLLSAYEKVGRSKS